MRLLCLVSVCVLSVVALGASQQAPPPASSSQLTKTTHYDHYLSGSAANVTPATRGGLLLAGGGTDQPDAFRWLISHAGGGDIVVLRASGSDGYHPFAMRLGGLDSIESFVVRSRDAASDATLLGRLRDADGIFFAGGDQSNYINFFKDTEVETIVNEAAARGVPIGGTSAGLAILSEFSYAALKQSITTEQATANPFDENITIERDFLRLPHMAGLITDSHVIERGRLGRTVTFLARLIHDGWVNAAPARAIAIDRDTAVLVETDGSAMVTGGSAAYFMSTTARPEIMTVGQPLTFGPVEVYRAPHGASFNLTTWSGTGGEALTMSVRAGTTYGPAR
ncbi:MAG: cyanophycinase [Acidobacteria bacterium]|nr:cyanophycinase [Acidobacteriota bacterium]